jgi:hypothetical protein
MKTFIHLENVHQNPMNQNENPVKHVCHAMNMIWEVVGLMVCLYTTLKESTHLVLF